MPTKAIQHDTEVERLLALPLSPEDSSLVETYYRAKWTAQTRRDYYKEHPENFAGDDDSYPIKDFSDVNDAWRLAGHAPDPDKVRSRIKSIAKRLGLESGLPDTAKEDDKDEDRTQEPVIIRADGNHDAFTGTHTHAHKAFGSQGSDETHAHEHAHSGDADHDHSHEDRTATPDITRTMPSETTIYAPILRIDRAKREVVLRATAEDLDSYGTVIGFDGSKEAFSKWRGNIREMHDPTRAVGRAIKWDPVEEERAIDITLRVSKGAEDTWQKVLDGTLAGGSIGARNGKWGTKRWKEKDVPFLERYDLVEVSLVDNPSCPGCDVKIVRADGMATDVLDFSEEETPPPTPQADITRYGARVSSDTRTALHQARDHAAQALRAAMSSCNCAECQKGACVLDPDMDGDIDIFADLDTDHDGAASGNGSGEASESIMHAVQSEIQRHMSPLITRMNGIAARFAATDTTPHETITHTDPQITRRLETIEQHMTGMATTTALDEVRSLVSEVKGLALDVKATAEQIAAQPAPGGPVVNAAALRNMPAPMASDPIMEDAATITRLAKAGILNKNQQIDAALYLQRARSAQQNGR